MIVKILKRHMLGKCLSALLLFAAANANADTITGKVVSVTDGDTITVLSGTTQHKIRLMGIDAQEKPLAFGGKRN